MKRAWFRDKDGTYYRNLPLIMKEEDRTLRALRWFPLLPWPWLRLRRLDAEWHRAWRDGLIRTDKLGRRDRVVTPRPFREAYPHDPILWTLDGSDQVDDRS